MEVAQAVFNAHFFGIDKRKIGNSKHVFLSFFSKFVRINFFSMIQILRGFFIFLVVILSACGTKKTPNSCTGVLCTADFRMMTIQLIDSIGADFVPDKVETYTEDSVLIQSQTGPAIPGQNLYTIIDDSHMNTVGVNIENNVLFKVFQNGQIIKQQVYKVKADCCHIIPISKDSTLVVN
jgi:hypothetical protein